jgi:flagellar biosynthesis protein FlhA
MPRLREQAHALGYTVVDASTVVATHLNHVILSHAAELLGRRKPRRCSTTSPRTAPKLVEDLVPKQLPLAACSACCRTCSKKASISATCAPSSRPSPSTRRAARIPLELTSQVRIALGRAIVQQLYPGNAECR